MKAKRFRDLVKERVPIQAPPEIARRIRRRALDERRSIAEVGTEALARYLGLDPATFGIEAPTVTLSSSGPAARY